MARERYEDEDEDFAPKKPKPKKPPTITTKTLAVQVILREGPEGVWKVDTLSVAP